MEAIRPKRHRLRSFRLSSPGMYRRIKSEGRVLRKPPLTMRHLSADDILDSRVGFMIRKRTGNAPLRNSIRRTLREAFRVARQVFARPAWVIFDVAENVAESPRRLLRQSADALLASLCRGAA